MYKRQVLDQDKIDKVPPIQKEVSQLQKQLSELSASSEEPFQIWLKDPELVEEKVEPPTDLAAHFQFDQDEDQDGQSVKNQTSKEDPVNLTGKVGFPRGKFGNAIRTRPNAFLRAPKTAENFAGDTALSYGCWVKLAGAQSGAPIARMDENSEHVGFDLYLQNNGVGAHFIHRWPQDAVKVIAEKKLKKNKWYHVFITYDGSKQAKGIRVYVDGEFLESSPSHNSLKGSTQSEVPFSVGRRQNGSQFNGFVDDVRIYERELSSSEVATLAQFDPLPGLLAVAEEERTPAQKKQLFSIYMEREVPGHKKLKGEIAGLQVEISKLKTPITTVMVMEDAAKPRMTYVLDRGQYDAPNKDKPVETGVPGFLPEFEGQFATNRLGMAQWLTSPDHPLTSRVAVNRTWKMFFGAGIVETVEDFGLQGTWPSHPKLLDWMARDFVDNGWDVKRLIKKIVLSETYQQSSIVTAKQLKLDPSNRYLSRGPRFRLAGEFLRDQALAISGLLNSKMGGPGVKPYQPEGLWNEVSLDKKVRFKVDSGDKLYRRSLYTYWKRSAPPPNMVLFDAPTREKCTLRRGETNTPLQALVLLNDPQYVEAARVFAERILREGGDSVGDKIDFAIRNATSKAPSPKMIEVLSKLVEKELKTFRTDSKRAKKLLSVGQRPADKKLDAAEVAAWTVISNLIFNLDEFVTRG